MPLAFTQEDFIVNISFYISQVKTSVCVTCISIGFQNTVANLINEVVALLNFHSCYFKL